MFNNHKLVLGFAHWGASKVPVITMMQTVEYALANGIDEIDCAPHYGNGAQENILSVALMNLPEKIRSQVKISTKVGRIIDPDNKTDTSNGFTSDSGFAQFFDYTQEGIVSSFKQSQLRLKSRSVHALYLHDMDIETHKEQFSTHYEKFIDRGYKAFDDLKEEKKIAIAGIGSNDLDICLRLIKDGRYRIDRIMIAGCYNLLNFSALTELFPLCKTHHIELYIAAPYGGGLLSGQEGNSFYRYQNASPELIHRVEKIKAICAKFEVSLPHAAMQFVHMHPQVQKIVVGARTPEELSASISYASNPINPSFWTALKKESLIPGTIEIPVYHCSPRHNLCLFTETHPSGNKNSCITKHLTPSKL